jgi:hypothetical protein
LLVEECPYSIPFIDFKYLAVKAISEEESLEAGP